MARRIARGHAEEENFLVSSADLMACVLFVFILLALVFAMKARQAQAVADTKSEQLDTAVRRWGDTSEARKKILEELQNSLRDKGIVVFVNQDNDGLRFPEGTLTFDQCSNELRVTDRANLATMAEVLGPVVQRFSQACGIPGSQATADQQIDVVLVEGHTDKRAPAPGCGYRDNWSLSTARASATRDLLHAANVSLGGLCNAQSRPLFAIAGYADQRPAASNRDDDNRRIELRFIMRPPAIESADAR